MDEEKLYDFPYEKMEDEDQGLRKIKKSASQFHLLKGNEVLKKKLQPGDIIFYKTGNRWPEGSGPGSPYKGSACNNFLIRMGQGLWHCDFDLGEYTHAAMVVSIEESDDGDIIYAIDSLADQPVNIRPLTERNATILEGQIFRATGNNAQAFREELVDIANSHVKIDFEGDIIYGTVGDKNGFNFDGNRYLLYQEDECWWIYAKNSNDVIVDIDITPLVTKLGPDFDQFVFEENKQELFTKISTRLGHTGGSAYSKGIAWSTLFPCFRPCAETSPKDKTYREHFFQDFYPNRKSHKWGQELPTICSKFMRECVLMSINTLLQDRLPDQQAVQALNNLIDGTEYTTTSELFQMMQLLSGPDSPFENIIHFEAMDWQNYLPEQEHNLENGTKPTLVRME